MNRESLREAIRQAVTDEGLAGFSARCGQSVSHVCNVIQGRRDPSEQMAAALGYAKADDAWVRK